jgi:hypothetical protein
MDVQPLPQLEEVEDGCSQWLQHVPRAEGKSTLLGMGLRIILP